MHLLSLDIETTGLDPLTDQILEIGCVVVDVSVAKPLKHQFRRLVSHPAYQGNAFALAMNSTTLYEIAAAEKEKKGTGTTVIVTLEELAPVLASWLENLPFYDEVEKFTLTGKNVGSFDLAFLRMIPGWNEYHKAMKIGHRCLDPGPLYFRPTDKVMPDLKTCLERAGIKRPVAHTAVADALAVLDVIQAAVVPTIHLKTGNTYYIKSTRVINATNGVGDMILYENEDGELFVRERNEFSEKFAWTS